jgi:hypothetical protein
LLLASASDGAWATDCHGRPHLRRHAVQVGGDEGGLVGRVGECTFILISFSGPADSLSVSYLRFTGSRFVFVFPLIEGEKRITNLALPNSFSFSDTIQKRKNESAQLWLPPIPPGASLFPFTIAVESTRGESSLQGPTDFRLSGAGFSVEQFMNFIPP